MSHRDDAHWERVIERLDDDVSELRGAEERLALAEAVPFGREEVEGMVGAVVARTPRRAVAVRKLAAAAALLLGALLAIAAVVYVAWPDEVDSGKTMTYGNAIALLERPRESPSARRAALGEIWGRLKFGVGELQKLCNDATMPKQIRDAARNRFAELGRIVASRSYPEPTRVDDRLLETAKLIRDGGSLTERLEALEHFADLVSSGAFALCRMVGPSEEIERDRAKCEATLRRMLGA